MIVWINGPFGGGKTQVAHELARRLPGSAVCDPELIGFGLQQMMPPGPRPDFQDLPAWREGVFEVLDRAARTYAGDLLVPMTVVVPGYLGQTVGRLREAGHHVGHVTLLADRESVRQRLRERAVGRPLARLAHPTWTPRRETWALAQLDRCLDALVHPHFATHLRTDDLTVPEVAERIAELYALPLDPRRGGPLRQRARQARVSLRHVRLD